MSLSKPLPVVVRVSAQTVRTARPKFSSMGELALWCALEMPRRWRKRWKGFLIPRQIRQCCKREAGSLPWTRLSSVTNVCFSM